MQEFILHILASKNMHGYIEHFIDITKFIFWNFGTGKNFTRPQKTKRLKLNAIL